MSVMSIAEAWPDEGRPFTFDDLERMPEDGRRYELLDGVLIVSPRPTTAHQEVAAALLGELRAARPEGIRVIAEPRVKLPGEQGTHPDLVAVRFDQFGGRRIESAPLLVVEIRSPGNWSDDLVRKKAAYRRFGVESYWIVVPDRRAPTVIVFEIRDGVYEEVAHIVGDEKFRARRPFPVDIVPSRLVEGLFPD